MRIHRLVLVLPYRLFSIEYRSPATALGAQPSFCCVGIVSMASNTGERAAASTTEQNCARTVDNNVQYG